MSQNCGHQRAYCSSPTCYVSMEAMVMMPAGDTSWLVHQISKAVLPAETTGASRRNGRRSENFAYQYLKYLKGSLTCRNILQRGNSGFTSHPKKGELWIFIALKKPSPLPALNPRPLGPVASTLTTTSPEAIKSSWKYRQLKRRYQTGTVAAATSLASPHHRIRSTLKWRLKMLWRAEFRPFIANKRLSWHMMSKRTVSILQSEAYKITILSVCLYP
jgi:hypothetical protein